MIAVEGAAAFIPASHTLEQPRRFLNGNRTSLRKRDGSVIAYQYDALGRMIVKRVPERSGLDPVHSRDVFYSYDLRGLQLSARFDSQSGEGITNVYDGFGRLVSHGIDMGGAARTLTYQWDANSSRNVLIYPDGVGTGTYHDGIGRPIVRFFHGGPGVAHAVYHPHGAPSAINRVGSLTGLDYDGVQRPSVRGLVFGGAVGNVWWSYHHNPASALASETRDNDDYAWAGHYPVERAYAANGLNQYSAAGAATFAYDPNGNLVSDGSRTFGYDVENRLVSASPGVTLSYDPLGRLFEVASPGGTTRFLYDGDALIAEYDNAGAMLRRHVHWPGADVPMASYEGAGLSAMRQLFSDRQGSIVAIADGEGMLAAINRYDEYGIPAAGNVGRFQYTGQIWLPELGMYHYKSRVYSPYLGRFLQTDPIGYDDQFNLYAYVGNDPVNATDPSGQVVVISRNGNSIRFNLHIAYYGPGNSASVRSKFSSGISGIWTGQFGRYNVQTRVIAYTYRPDTRPSPGYADRNPLMNFVLIPKGSDRAFTTDGRMGTWPADRPAWTAAHEGGHMMGVPDQQSMGGGPNPGYEESIMAVRYKPPTERDIEDILRANMRRNRREDEPPSDAK